MLQYESNFIKPEPLPRTYGTSNRKVKNTFEKNEGIRKEKHDVVKPTPKLTVPAKFENKIDNQNKN